KVFMEALSPTMEEGRLVKWLKNEGDAIKSGDVLAEVETDKAIMELVARGDGMLRKRLVGDGESRPVGQLVGVIAPADENIDALVAGAGAPAPAAAAPPAPAADAQQAAAAAPAAVPAAPASPVAAAAPPTNAPPAAPQPTPAAPAGDGNGGHLRSSPLARRLASERGLDLAQVHGSGPGGRIIKRDIESAQTAAAAAAPARAAVAAPRAASAGDFEDIPLTQIRKTIAKRLAESIGPIPTFYLTAEFDLSRVVEMRAAMVEMGDEFKVSINDVLMKAVATALAQHPEVNAHWLGDRIRQHHRVHLGMAVATPDGLIVPVIFDADQKRMSDISHEARELAKKARERKLKPEEYTGSTFSISNLGMFGIDQFTAIINPPETAILAIGTAQDVVVPHGDGFVTQKRLRVTLSCDHRAVDGAVGAAFLQTLRRLIENPLMMVF
ncbi:MAG TPA: pyruvate dehydrogenase complex dihydrolipoamide acetyltransferase, partial [Gemmatimonadaceae bacterium]|nr:pyruvate dehydrogenase complex dihydrolipoamide acetyltransferase [Gemmatimonadaceae bacterium]